MIWSTHTLIYRRNPGVHALAQVGGDELRSRMPSDVSSVFSVDIHRNIISRTSLGSTFRIYIRSHEELYMNKLREYTPIGYQTLIGLLFLNFKNI